MSGDTWTAVDGTVNPAIGTSWISDTGLYTGPIPAVLYPDASWVPPDAAEVDWYIAKPNPDTDETHVVDGSYSTHKYIEYFLPDFTSGVGGGSDPAADVDSGAHLFVVWFVPGVGPTDSTSLLVAPSLSPLDIAPTGWVSGGRLDTTAGFTSATVGAPTFTLSAAGTAGTGDALAILLASVLSYDTSDRVTAPLVGPVATITTDPRPTLALYTADGTFKIANLRRAIIDNYQEQLSEPGSLSFSLALDDPVRTSVTPGRIVKVFWRGQARFVARINGHSTDLAVDGNVWRKWENLPGVLDMLNDGVIMPEYGLRATSGDVRNFGPMNHYGAWYASGNWQRAAGIWYQDDTGFRKRKPLGLYKANPQWISKTGPYHNEPAGTTFWFRKTFYTSGAPMTYRILAGADMHLTLYMDGEEVFTPDQQESHSWRYIARIPGTFDLEPGRHVIAAKVQNNRHKASPIAFWCLVQQTDAKGDPVKGPAMIRTQDHWTVSDQDPGWNPGEMVVGMMYESRIYPVPALSTIGRSFSSVSDSHGVAWGDPDIYAYPIGTGLLDMTQQLGETKFSAWVNPNILSLALFQRMGYDRTADVTLDLGADGGPIMEHAVDRIGPRYNSAVTQKRDGTWTVVEDASSVSDNGRAMIGLSIGSTADDNTATKVARNQFKETAVNRYTFTTTLSALTGPQVYEDFWLGDTILVPNEDGSGHVKARVIAITVDCTGEVVKVIPELSKDLS